MKLDLTSMFFNGDTATKGNTASWGTALGQMAPDYLITVEGGQELFDSMQSSDIKINFNPSEFDSHKANIRFDGKKIIGAGLYKKCFLNGEMLESPFILLVLEEIGGSHPGRKSLKYNDKIVFNEYSNENFYKEVQGVFGEQSTWFGIDLSINANNELHLTAKKVSDSPITYPDPPTRSNEWSQLREGIHDYSMKLAEDKAPLNQILFGPPGTGKTFNAIIKAVEIITGKRYTESKFTECKAEYDRLVSEGRIHFITFHQSYSYEDFMEGLKPISSGDQVSYEIIPGVFKKVCELAKGDSKPSSAIKAIQDFSNYIIEDGGGEVKLKTLVQKKTFKVRINSLGNFLVQPDTATGTQMVVTKEYVNNYLMYGIADDWKPYTSAIGEEIKTRYKIDLSADEKNHSRSERYVLIIDEINRGNVSKIFGELITLIEEPKRIGNAEEMRIKLTYSSNKEGFGVPNNLYILGTMNTADRSITSIDTALRRRFVFQEYQPNSNLKFNKIKFQGKTIELSKILEIINMRLEYLLDKDHQIGHSYFLGIRTWSDLLDAFRDKIIPLLQEFFFNDFSKIALVLGDNGDVWNKVEGNNEKIILVKRNNVDQLFGPRNNIDIIGDESTYFINPNLINREYTKISPEFFLKGFQ